MTWNESLQLFLSKTNFNVKLFVFLFLLCPDFFCLKEISLNCIQNNKQENLNKTGKYQLISFRKEGYQVQKDLVF